MKKRTGKNKKRKELIFLYISVFCLVGIILYGCYITAGMLLGSKELGHASINYDNVNVTCPPIKKMYLTPNKNSRPKIPLKQVNGIVIHYTANPGTDAKANRDYFEGRRLEPNESKNKVSSHFVIGLDGTIIQCIPLDEISYASNNRNSDTISVECCHPDATGKFTNKTYSSLIKLCAYLCGTYHLSKEDIIRHYDVTGKLCPKYYVNHSAEWDRMKNDIIAQIE